MFVWPSVDVLLTDLPIKQPQGGKPMPSLAGVHLQMGWLLVDRSHKQPLGFTCSS